MPLISAIAGALNGIPVVSTICGMEIPNPNQPESDQLWRQGAHYMMDAYRNISQHTAVSDATGILARQVMPELDVKTLYAGIDIDKYDQIAPAPILDEPYIMSLRRLEKSKGIDVLIRAYAKLIHGHETIPKLAVVGDGEERSNLERLAHELGVSDQVVFAGTLPIELAIGGLKCAEMTVVPSLAEAGGLINTEANAVSCPLITTDVGGIREYTGKDSALFVNPSNVDMLVTAIKELHCDKILRQQMVGNGRKFAESRAWQSVIKDYLRLYETAKPIPTDKLRLSSELGKRILRILSNE
jgi:glycosyltransferase involved in cell wall biosynthesis